MASDASPPRTMSSRLLTMKFMQRPSGSSTSSSKQIKGHSKKINGEADLVTEAAVRKAIEDREEQRAKALEAHREELGDTPWVLDMPDNFQANRTANSPFNMVYVGLDEIDDCESEAEEETPLQVENGRMKTKNHKTKEEKENEQKKAKPEEKVKSVSGANASRDLMMKPSSRSDARSKRKSTGDVDSAEQRRKRPRKSQ